MNKFAAMSYRRYKNKHAWWLRFDTCENYLYNKEEDKNVGKVVVEWYTIYVKILKTKRLKYII
jgi:hypothetical protein